MKQNYEPSFKEVFHETARTLSDSSRPYIKKALSVDFRDNLHANIFLPYAIPTAARIHAEGTGFGDLINKTKSIPGLIVLSLALEGGPNIAGVLMSVGAGYAIMEHPVAGISSLLASNALSALYEVSRQAKRRLIEDHAALNDISLHVKKPLIENHTQNESPEGLESRLENLVI